MKRIIIILIGILSIINGYSQCPKIKGILIDACGTREETNEWMVLTTNADIVVNNLQIDFDANNNTSGASNGDINGVSCSWITPRTSSIDSLKVNTNYNTNIIPTSPGATIPANSTILILTSDSLTFPYNITNLTMYGNVYVLQSSCKRTIGAFTNLGNGANYRITKISYNSCRDSVWHYIGNTAVNGHYGVKNRDTMRISFGNLYASSCNYYMILPIELMSFTGEQINGINEIKWITLSERNNAIILLLRSNNGENWEEIYSIGGSNTSYMFRYEYDDNSFEKNNLYNYYKLMQVDIDGTFVYSNIIAIRNLVNVENIFKVKYYNILGQEINKDDLLINTLYIKGIIYSDNSHIYEIIK